MPFRSTSRPRATGPAFPPRSTGTAQAFRSLPWGLLRHLRCHQAGAFILFANFYASIPIVLLSIWALTILTWFLDPAGAAILTVGLAVTLASLLTIKTI